MPALHDGFRVTIYPEVIALLRFMGIPQIEESKRLRGIAINLVDPDDKVEVTATEVHDNYKLLYTRWSEQKCFEVYRSKEFRAFCNALGIAWEKMTKTVAVRIFEGEQVIVTQSYVAEAPDAPSVVVNGEPSK